MKPTTRKEQSAFDEIKRKPCNMQAVRVLFRSADIHKAPPEPTPNVMEERKAAQIRLRKRADELELQKKAHAEWVEMRKREGIAKERARAEAQKDGKHIWIAKFMKRKAKRQGKPAPTTAEIQQAQKDYAAGKIRF